jgi:hypothetical protein
MGISAFTPTGNTVAFTAAATAPTPVQAVSTTLGGNQYLITNAGNVTVFLGFGATSAQASNSSGSISTTGNTIPILSNTVQVFSFVPNAWFTGNATNSSIVYVTPGDGV